MLAERVVEWTQEWKQQGFEEGRAKEAEKTVEMLRAKLLTKLEERFAALPEGVRQRVVSLGSAEELAELLSRWGTAPSLASLGLAGD
jgi:hypothetical protein